MYLAEPRHQRRAGGHAIVAGGNIAKARSYPRRRHIAAFPASLSAGTVPTPLHTRVVAGGGTVDREVPLILDAEASYRVTDCLHGK